MCLPSLEMKQELNFILIEDHKKRTKHYLTESMIIKKRLKNYLETNLNGKDWTKAKEAELLTGIKKSVCLMSK